MSLDTSSSYPVPTSPRRQVQRLATPPACIVGDSSVEWVPGLNLCAGTNVIPKLVMFRLIFVQSIAECISNVVESKVTVRVFNNRM